MFGARCAKWRCICKRSQRNVHPTLRNVFEKVVRSALPFLLLLGVFLVLTQAAPAASAATTPTGTKLTACGDLTRPGTYYLANDVSSTVGCFAINAAGITLNLNGHTITYDTGGSSHEPAIQGHDCWSTINPVIAGDCGNSHGGLEVYGGTIRQAESAQFIQSSIPIRPRNLQYCAIYS